MARVANPWEASTGAHAADVARPPLEPPKQTTPGNGPSPAGRVNSPHTPGSRTGVAVAPRVSQCRSRTASAIRAGGGGLDASGQRGRRRPPGQPDRLARPPQPERVDPGVAAGPAGLPGGVDHPGLVDVEGRPGLVDRPGHLDGGPHGHL
jgi:hypothetical protein